MFDGGKFWENAEKFRSKIADKQNLKKKRDLW